MELGVSSSQHTTATARFGLVTSVVAIALWIGSQFSDQIIFLYSAIPVKLALLAAPLFFFSDLSSFLYRKPGRAVALGFILILATFLATCAYLPWRDAFARHFNDSVIRSYYVGMPNPESHPGFDQWQKNWNRRIPHLIEAATAGLYFTVVIGSCCLVRLNRALSFIVALIGYAIVFAVPMVSGLVLWDYDTFLRGIVFDSISMDLYPRFIWAPFNQSIFLYSFMLILFGVSFVFIHFCHPRIAKTVDPASH